MVSNNADVKTIIKADYKQASIVPPIKFSKIADENEIDIRDYKDNDRQKCIRSKYVSTVNLCH